jgi:hypothetical protein
MLLEPMRGAGFELSVGLCTVPDFRAWSAPEQWLTARAQGDPERCSAAEVEEYFDG